MSLARSGTPSVQNGRGSADAGSAASISAASSRDQSCHRA